jgi:serine/threonine protein kinase/tetratricopeptide (TPR) repeat protein
MFAGRLVEPSPPALLRRPVSDSLRQTLQTSLGTAYTIERELGGGGMSRVYVASESALGRMVVIKLLPPELAAGVSTERFRREIQLAARLQHPHIVPLLTAGESDGLPYFTMPYIDGESLRVRLAKRGEMPVAEAVRVLREIASALAYAHAHGVVHRDIKPDNVLLSGGAAMVTDFGVAKALSASSNAEHGGVTSLGVALGTPAYMAPEQASADPTVDHRADVYAFGILAYELLTGQTPFGGRTPQGLLAAHVTEPPEPIQKRRASLPPALAALVMRCLEKRPADRPQTAEEIVHALDDLTTPSGGMPPTLVVAPTKTPTSSSGRRIVFAAAAVVAVLVLGGAGYAWRSRAIVSTADAATVLTLAVLPFDNAGANDQASFTDGLTDAVTAKLSALPTLAVIDRRSSAQYRASTKPAKQIGTELGVSYLLEGVVRWAKDRAGVWRAQVTPTLVDARTGTTKWTGEPVIVAPDDPFSAQSAIATKVVDALEIALRPTDRAELQRPYSSNPEAFASYERGKAIFTAARGPSDFRRAIAEYAHAVELDSTFADAWVGLESAHITLVYISLGDREAEAQARSLLAQALARFPGHPHLLLQLAQVRLQFDHDTLGLDTLVRRALTAAPNDAWVLSLSAGLLRTRLRYDSAYSLMARAAQLDPRSPNTLLNASGYAIAINRTDEALRYADALIALDSTDERGWLVRLGVSQTRGDTTATQHELRRATAAIPHPGIDVLVYMPYAGDDLARRFLTLSARDLEVTSSYDSVFSYLDTKADACARISNAACERAYYDSIAAMLTNRQLSGGAEGTMISELALAQAALGRATESHATLDRLFALRSRTAARSGGAEGLDATVMAGTYARLGEPDSAVSWLERSLMKGIVSYSAKSFALNPKLRLLRGTPAFERFLRAHSN